MDNDFIIIALIILLGGGVHLVLSGQMPGIKYSSKFSYIEDAPAPRFLYFLAFFWIAFALVVVINPQIRRILFTIQLWGMSLVFIFYIARAIKNGVIHYPQRYALSMKSRWKRLYIIERANDPIPFWVGVLFYLLFPLSLVWGGWYVAFISKR